MAANDTLEYLDSFAGIDWSNGDLAAETSANLLERIQSDREGLGELVRRVGSDQKLLSMCESDEFRFKIVLYDALDRGFRIRLHAWRSDFADTPHQHRFAYTTRVLMGSYEHVIYKAGQPLTPAGVEQHYDRHLPLTHEFVAGRIDPSRFTRILSFTAVAGESYFQSSDIDLSSTRITKNTVSLFVRGPAVRDCAFQWHRDRGTVVWRAGQAHVSAVQRESVRADPQQFDDVVSRLTAMGIVNSQSANAASPRLVS